MTNEQIARDVMGWEIIEYDNGVTDMVFPDGVVRKSGSVDNYYDFLNDHNAAMMVVEKMRKDGFIYKTSNTLDGVNYFRFFNDHSDVAEGCGLNNSLCHAICEAALKAKGITP